MTAPRGDDDPLMFSFFNEIGIIDQLAGSVLERALSGGLRMAHFVVLNHFVRLGGSRSPAELARAFQVTRGAMTNTIRRLQARRLVAVTPDPDDGRAKRVAITAAGRRVRDQAVGAIGAPMGLLEARFGADRFRDALPFLRQLRAHLDAARDG